MGIPRFLDWGFVTQFPSGSTSLKSEQTAVSLVEPPPSSPNMSTSLAQPCSLPSEPGIRPWLTGAQVLAEGHTRRLGGRWRIFTRQEHVCSILIPKVNEFHLLQCVHIHFHGRDTTYGGCRSRRGQVRRTHAGAARMLRDMCQVQRQKLRGPGTQERRRPPRLRTYKTSSLSQS